MNGEQARPAMIAATLMRRARLHRQLGVGIAVYGCALCGDGSGAVRGAPLGSSQPGLSRPMRAAQVERATVRVESARSQAGDLFVPLAWNQSGEPESVLTPEHARHVKEIGLSLLLPGLVQWQSGERAKGGVFLLADAACWASAMGFRIQGNLRRDSYIEMARIYAGVRASEGRTNDYYRLIGLLPSNELYDELVRRDARRIHEDDLAGREAYFEANRIPDDLAWEWESDRARDRYRQKRNDTQRSFRRSRNLLGLAVANRLVAMVDAVMGRDSAGRSTIRVVPDGTDGHLGAQLTWTTHLP